MISGGGRFRSVDGTGVRVVDARIVWGGHDGFIGSSYSIGVSEWGSDSDSRSRYREVLFLRDWSGSRVVDGGQGIRVFPS